MRYIKVLTVLFLLTSWVYVSLPSQQIITSSTHPAVIPQPSGVGNAHQVHPGRNKDFQNGISRAYTPTGNNCTLGPSNFNGLVMTHFSSSNLEQDLRKIFAQYLESKSSKKFLRS